MRRPAYGLFLSMCLIAAGGGVHVLAQADDPKAEEAGGPPDIRADAVAWPVSELAGRPQALAAGNGRFVVVGGVWDGAPRATAWTSTDGLTWTESPGALALAGATMYRVTYFRGGFVALGTEGAERRGAHGKRVVAWSSPDGVTWRREDVPRPGLRRTPGLRRLDAGVAGLAAGPTGLLALANYGLHDLSRYRLWRSEDGSSWEVTALPRAGVSYYRSLVGYPGGHLFGGFAVGEHREVRTSTLGVA